MKNLIRFALVAGALLPGIAMAAAPSLQVNPLKYQSTMLNTDVREGYVDVSNPSDTTLNIDADVQGFRQDDLAGDLTFFNNLAIQQAITLGLTQFQLAPQEAVRVTFTVDPTKLPKGGTYAALFFRTVPPQQSSSSSFVAESANVGTLLLLQNGPANAQIGQVNKFDLPFFQFGTGIKGTAQYQNTNHSTAPVAFAPSLVSKVFPWGHGSKLTGPYVLPGSTRQFSVIRQGSFIGLLPISLIDQSSGIATTRWVFALTGVYAFLFIFLVAFLVLLAGYRLVRRQPILPRNFSRNVGRNNKAGDGHPTIDTAPTPPGSTDEKVESTREWGRKPLGAGTEPDKESAPDPEPEDMTTEKEAPSEN